MFDRVRIIHWLYKLSHGTRDKLAFVSSQAKAVNQISISISKTGVKRLIKKWLDTNQVADRMKKNVFKCLISKDELPAINKALLKRQTLNRYLISCNKIKRIFCGPCC